MKRAIALAGALVLAACGGGDDAAGGIDPALLCDSISGGGSTLESDQAAGCLFCSVSNVGAAADASLDTFAEVNVPTAPAGQGITIRATTQDGIVFPSGQRAGVYFVGPLNSGVNSADLAISITTYLDGDPVESPASQDDYDLVGTTGGNPYSFKSFVTTEPFDAVEVLISDTQGATGPFQIHEICSNGEAG